MSGGGHASEVAAYELPTVELCGQLTVVGLAGATLGDDEKRAFARGERGGVVIFKRNLENGPESALNLARAVTEAAPAALPPLVAIDQEGGRVARLGLPVFPLPPAGVLAAKTDADFIRRAAEALGRELAALGITMDFAPVVDVHTWPENPVITADRTFGNAPEEVFRLSLAFAEGLAAARVLSCAKHFPGHGDSRTDSHFDLPRVDREAAALRAIELAPFFGHARAGVVPSMMTAHVVYPALDPDAPATLSRRICTDILRGEMKFSGVLFSDDLEMKAIRAPIAEAATLAILAGCDALLVCSRADLAAAAHEALVHEAEKSVAFRARCVEACSRVLAMRRRVRPAPLDTADLARVFAANAGLRDELARRVASS